MVCYTIHTIQAQLVCKFDSPSHSLYNRIGLQTFSLSAMLRFVLPTLLSDACPPPQGTFRRISTKATVGYAWIGTSLLLLLLQRSFFGVPTCNILVHCIPRSIPTPAMISYPGTSGDSIIGISLGIARGSGVSQHIKLPWKFTQGVEVVECTHITGLDFELTCAIFKFFCHFNSNVREKKNTKLSPAGFEPAPPEEDCHKRFENINKR